MDLAQNQIVIWHIWLQAKHGFGAKSACNTAWIVASKTWISPQTHLKLIIDWRRPSISWALPSEPFYSIRPSILLHPRSRPTPSEVNPNHITFLRSYVPMFLCSYVPTFLRSYVPMFLCSYVPTFLCSYVPTFFTYVAHAQLWLALWLPPPNLSTFQLTFVSTDIRVKPPRLTRMTRMLCVSRVSTDIRVNWHSCQTS